MASGANGPAPSDPFQAMMANMLNSSGQNEGMPDFSRLLAQTLGMPESSTPNLLGDLDDPAGLSGAPPFPAGFPMAQAGSARPSRVDRFYPLVHLVSILALMAFVVVWWEPNIRLARWGVSLSWRDRWSALSPQRNLLESLKETISGVERLVRPTPTDLRSH